MTRQKEISLQTAGHRDIKDLTGEVARIIAGSGITTGIAHVSVVGSTAAVGGIELEPGLAKDLPDALDRLLPPSRAYGTSRPGTMATVTPTCRQRSSANP
jgi:thiamine phosphate synthase YjbQ (UPF0047 family)